MLQRLASIGRNRYVVAITAGSLAGLVLLMFFLLVRGQRDTVVLHVDPIADSSVIHVYVGGEVTNPGLFSLDRGSRVADAITAAGGLLTGADTAGIGMAAVLNDSDQIIVPPRRATPVALSTYPAPRPTEAGQGGTTVPATAPTSGIMTQLSPVAQGSIDVNRAMVSELDLLPGIGPAISARIIEYRQIHGPFQTLEELAEVSGISDRMVEELLPLITLGH